jgi:hypothetical protein
LSQHDKEISVDYYWTEEIKQFFSASAASASVFVLESAVVNISNCFEPNDLGWRGNKPNHFCGEIGK